VQLQLAVNLQTLDFPALLAFGSAKLQLNLGQTWDKHHLAKSSRTPVQAVF